MLQIQIANNEQPAHGKIFELISTKGVPCPNLRGNARGKGLHDNTHPKYILSTLYQHPSELLYYLLTHFTNTLTTTGYLYAKREGMNLRLFIDTIAPQQPW